MRQAQSLGPYLIIANSIINVIRVDSNDGQSPRSDFSATRELANLFILVTVPIFLMIGGRDTA